MEELDINFSTKSPEFKEIRDNGGLDVDKTAEDFHAAFDPFLEPASVIGFEPTK
ncbi:MAG: hypothetical protein LBR11_11600 [Deltaproteobacteria bacterium]|jgi:hypothetical protein|nr:hypothetical protein [Deltaproteobacteria bacterium]